MRFVRPVCRTDCPDLQHRGLAREASYLLRCPAEHANEALAHSSRVYEAYEMSNLLGVLDEQSGEIGACHKVIAKSLARPRGKLLSLTPIINVSPTQNLSIGG